MANKKVKYLPPEEALKKLQRYCAYQDRCHQEVRTKLLDLGIYGDALEEIIADLVTDNFLNEERFACSYARGKFRIKKWGKVRIRQELKLKKISAYCIKKAWEEIDGKEYREALNNLITKKNTLLKEPNLFKRKRKLVSYAVQKGYESKLIWEVIKGMNLENHTNKE